MTRDAQEMANRARVQILNMCAGAKAAHIASSLSCVDILAVLYAGAARVDAARMDDPDRDVVVVSKGHAAAGTYAVLAEAGFFSLSMLADFGNDGSPLGGHVTHSVAGVELSTGSLGHGLPYGVGVSLAHRRSGSSAHVFVVMSDGECDEGTTWESALLAAHHRLGGLTVMIDRNRIQSLAGTEETLRLEPLADKWHSFGWQVMEVDGHDHQAMADAVGQSRAGSDRPSVIICHTIKGKGVSFMEDQVLWHYRPPTSEEAAAGIAEILARGGTP